MQIVHLQLRFRCGAAKRKELIVILFEMDGSTGHDKFKSYAKAFVKLMILSY